jgi:hypothetical protein
VGSCPFFAVSLPFLFFFYDVLCAEETKFSAKGRYPVHFPIDPGRAVGKNDGDSCPIDLELEHFLEWCRPEFHWYPTHFRKKRGNGWGTEVYGKRENALASHPFRKEREMDGGTQ